MHNDQYLYIIKFKNDKDFNFKNRIPEDETMTIKNVLTIITGTYHNNELRVVLEYIKEPFSKLVTFVTGSKCSINAFSKIDHQ